MVDDWLVDWLVCYIFCGKYYNVQKKEKMMDKKDNDLLNKITSLEATIAEQRNTISRLKAIIEDYKKKEQSISSAIIASMEHANQLEASRKKLYLLDIQRSRLMYLRMEQIINELYARYPELKKDTKLKDISDKFRSMVYNEFNDKNNNSINFDIKKPVVDDPIKKLLHNIIDCFDSKKVGGDVKRGGPTDELINNVSSSGFDFNEALHPTMELEEIMKVFNLGNKPNGEKPVE